MVDSLDLTPEEIAEVKARREARETEAKRAAAEAAEAAEAEKRAAEAEAARAAAEAEAKSRAVKQRRDWARKDEGDAYAIVEALARVVEKIRSIRSRLGSERDATAASGHLLGALLASGGVVSPETGPHRVRHALGGEAHSLLSPERAAIALSTLLFEGLIEPRSPDEAARVATASETLHAIADIWTGHDRLATAREQVEVKQRADAEALARSRADAHHERLGKAAAEALAKAAKPPRQPAPQHRPVPIATDAAGIAERKRLARLAGARGAPSEPADLGGELLEDGDGAFVPDGSVEGLSDRPETE